MRIYIPATHLDLDSEGVSPRIVHAVTPELPREIDLNGVPDSEVCEILEAVAMNAAADDSLRLLRLRAGAGVSVAPYRIVIVADIDDVYVARCGDSGQLVTARETTAPVAWADVCAIHVDDSEACALIERAMGGDDEAFERSYEEDLMWHDVLERTALRARFA